MRATNHFYFLLTILLSVIATSNTAYAQCTFNLGPDISVCQGQTINVPISGPTAYTSYLWSTGSTNQSITATAAGTYICTASLLSNDLVVNGNFTAGNTGFTSNYTLGTGGSWGLVSNPGTYAVTTSPNLAHSNFFSFGDHSSGTGNMLVCNGSAIANDIVWSQTITVTPNTNYNFSAWMASVENLSSSSQAAQLQFSINGTLIGPVSTASLTAGQWSQFFVNWNSGVNTSAVITIVDQNVQQGSNDFVLDDIFFQQICVAADTLIVKINPLPNVSSTSPVALSCVPSTVQLNAASTSPNVNYNWSGAGIVSGGTTATPTVNAAGVYTVTVTDPVTNCSNTATVNVSAPVLPLANAGSLQTITCTSTTVTLNGSASSANMNYSWTGPAAGVPAGTTPAAQSTTVNSAGTYTLTVTNPIDGCTATSTVLVDTNKTLPIVNAGPDLTLPCAVGTVNLNPLSQQSNYTYQWAGPNGFSSTQFLPASPVSSIGTYSLTAINTANGCQKTDVVVVNMGIAPVAGFSSNPISGLAPLPVQFTNTSTNASFSTWYFGDGASATNTNSPVNTYMVSGNYTVMLIASNGTQLCNDTAYTEIWVYSEPIVVIPNIFTPNEDNINDVFNIKTISVKELTVDIFNRWGTKVNSFDGMSGHWDGKNQSEGTYYYIAKGKGIDGSSIDKQGNIMLVK